MANKRREGEDISYPNQVIVNVPLEEDMQKAYIDYAMSVIVGRALPDVRDGLKPVHRRILYTMYEAGLTSDKKYSKSVATVGDVLKKYHPHGDSSVYDALVRLAQNFSMRYQLVDGRGNFGSVDGDPAAAYRYTEARLAKLSNEMLRDIEKDTVDWLPNFDETMQEPLVIPSRFPNLLVNGSSGIAVGMTTNIPPHNLTETINAVICLINNPDATLDELMEHIKGPDFPTRGIIMGQVGIRAAYATGKGRVKVRARTELEEFGQGRTRIIVTEIPYQVNKSRLVEAIAEQVKNKKIEGISGLRDESDREGMRIVIELKKDANSQVVLNRLFDATQMQVTFAIVMLALVNNQKQPKILTLKEILQEYVAFQQQVIRRRTVFDKKKAAERAHILEGLRIAVDNIDEIIRIIRSSYDNAKERIMETFSLSDVQAQSILEMQLRRLQGLEREKIENEYNELMEKIAYYEQLLANPEMLNGVLISELEQIRDKYGDERRTEIAPVEDEIDIEDLIDEEDCVYTCTSQGYIKRSNVDTYKLQGRGGKGVKGMSTKDEDYVEAVFVASTHDYLLMFTDRGRIHRVKGYMVPEAGRSAKGKNIVNILFLEPDEKVTAMVPVREFTEDEFIIMVTKQGEVKRISLSALYTARRSGVKAFDLEDTDELVSILKTDGEQNIILSTKDGMAICFKETDIRTTGREAGGVRGIRLSEGDFVIGACVAQEGAALLSVTENGFGKRTAIEEYFRSEDGHKEPQKRGGKGLKGYNVTDKTGCVVAAQIVKDDDDVLLISDDGTIIRTAASDINLYGRAVQGVRVMKVADGAKVISMACTASMESEEQGE
ncbi:MAG: DNA gyrase subunit A [Oscillospiraceae bacterium]|nr:DNA gyrase subunit A [Oscillospiraceae bacterium]